MILKNQRIRGAQHCLGAFKNECCPSVLIESEKVSKCVKKFQCTFSYKEEIQIQSNKKPVVNKHQLTK